MGRPKKEDHFESGPQLKLRPPKYVYDRMVIEAESQRRSIASIMVEWLEATYSRRYEEEE